MYHSCMRGLHRQGLEVRDAITSEQIAKSGRGVVNDLERKQTLAKQLQLVVSESMDVVDSA
eukprot:14024164-Alexandrium_andersonii.AAC.1